MRNRWYVGARVHRQPQPQSQSQQVSCLVGSCLIFIQMAFDYPLEWRFHNLSQTVWCGVCFPS